MLESSLYLDRYKITERLGVGGIGEVWLAHDQELDEKVALKFLRPSFSKEQTEFLKRETKQARQLNHPNILRVFDFHIQPDSPAAISMEYVSGGNLAQLMSSKRPVLEADDIKDWLQQVCDALSYAHEKCGIVHRDIKPTNLMLDRDGQLKLADFGLASQIAPNLDPESEKVIGSRLTLHYASPQLIWNPSESHHLNDVFAFGVTVFWLMTASYPFKDPEEDSWTWDPDNLLSMSRRRKEKGVGQKPVPEEWDYAIARCIAENPEDRPANFRKISKLLKIGTKPYSAVGTPPPPALKLSSADSAPPVEEKEEKTETAKTPYLILLIAGLLGIVIGVAWGVYRLKKNSEPAPPPVERVNTLEDR